MFERGNDIRRTKSACQTRQQCEEKMKIPPVKTPQPDPVAKPADPPPAAAKNSEAPDTSTQRSAATPRGPSTMQLRLNKLAALTAALSSLPQTAEPFTDPNAGRTGSASPSQEPPAVFSGSQIKKIARDSGHETEGFSATNLGCKNTGEDDNIEEYNDFGEQWVGEVPDFSMENPENFPAKFKNADEDFDPDELKVYAYALQIDAALAVVETSTREDARYQVWLHALGSACVEMLTLLCEHSSATPHVPAFTAVKNSTLTQVDRLFRSSGDEEGRRSWLQKIDQIFSNAGINKLGSVPEMMLSHLAEDIAREINKNVAGANNEESVTGAAMHAPLVSILDHYRRMHERQASLETLSGNHAEATALLQTCLSVVTTKSTLDPERAGGNHVTLYFDLLKSQILAKDEEAVSTLEDLCMTMLAYAEENAFRFPPDFPQALFAANLDDAYSEFLNDLENEAVKPSLEHPIARLFAEANERGVFDDPKLD